MDRRTLLTISICFLIFMGWQKFYLEPHMPRPGQSIQSQPLQSEQVEPTNMTSAGASSLPLTAAAPVQTLTLATPDGEAVLGNGPNLFIDWHLKTYQQSLGPGSAAIDMHSVTNRNGEVELAFDDPEFAYLSSVSGNLSKTANGALWTYEDNKVKLIKEVSTSGDSPYLNLRISADFKAKRPNNLFVSLIAQGLEKDTEARDRQLAWFTNDSVERQQLKSSMDLKDITTDVSYITATSRYFLLALIPQGDSKPKGLIQPLGPMLARGSLRYPLNSGSVSVPLRAFFGPKEIDLLKNVDPKLNHTIDFGWFEVIAYPLLSILRWLHEFVKNYGVAIILLTLLLKIVTYPLTYKSMKSMKEMARIQPQLQKIREKYKDDREALNREMMTLMKTHGYNPMAGCLPMVIQMPIFFALYRVLYNSIELFHAPFALWIQDLSRPDSFYVTPILLAITMFIQQKLSPNTAADPAQQKMMQFMPLMFGAFMLGLPSGLTLYMLVNALASIVQQLILNKKLNPGHVPALAARAR